MAGDMFLKIEGIKGESHDDKHKDEIDVLSWSWGMTQEGSTHGGGGGGSGKVNVQDINFTKKICKATPLLMAKCSDGKHIKSATLTMRKAAGDNQLEYLVVKLTDVLISSYQQGGSDGGDIPFDSFSLNFAKVEYDYKPQKADGTEDAAVSHGWDLKTNKAVP